MEQTEATEIRKGEGRRVNSIVEETRGSTRINHMQNSVSINLTEPIKSYRSARSKCNLPYLFFFLFLFFFFFYLRWPVRNDEKWMKVETNARREQIFTTRAPSLEQVGEWRDRESKGGINRRWKSLIERCSSSSFALEDS